MRHLFIPLLILSMAFSFTACGTSPAASKPQTAPAATGTQTRTEAEQEEDPEITVKAAEPSESPKTNILVVYFSCTGTTQELAGYAAEYLNADSFKIEARVPYTDEDIAYYTDCRADKEQNDPAARPEIADQIENIDQYDTIILGYPIWHGQAPRIISSFLESYDFSGKTILPFCTSHSSGIRSSDTDLHDLCSAEWLSGKRFPAGTGSEEISSWLEESGIRPFAADTESEGEANVGEFNFETGSVLLISSRPLCRMRSIPITRSQRLLITFTASGS